MTCSLIRTDTGLPFVAQAQMEPNSDGSVSFLLPTGGYAGQVPNVYGAREDSAATQQYQRATLAGNVVTFVTRDGDLPCGYLLVQGQVYPA